MLCLMATGVLMETIQMKRARQELVLILELSLVASMMVLKTTLTQHLSWILLTMNQSTATLHA